MTMIQTLELVPSPIALLRSRDIGNPEREIAAGRLIRVRRGVLAPRVAWTGLTPWDRYLARVHAVGLVQPGVVFTHESAAALWGMPLLGDPRVVHVTGDPSRTARLRGGIRVHTTTDDTEPLSAAGLLVAAPADTAVTIARSRHPALALACADAACRLDPFLDHTILQARNEERPSSRGRRAARWSLERATPLAESTLESMSRALIEWLGFPEPELQHPFPTARGGIEHADFWWEWLGLVGEADGDLKYDGRFGDPLERLRARRDRDMRMLAGQASQVEHWGWTEMSLVAPVRAVLTGAGLRAVRPEDPAALATFRALLSSS